MNTHTAIKKTFPCYYEHPTTITKTFLSYYEQPAPFTNTQQLLRTPYSYYENLPLLHCIMNSPLLFSTARFFYEHPAAITYTLLLQWTFCCYYEHLTTVMKTPSLANLEPVTQLTSKEFTLNYISK